MSRVLEGAEDRFAVLIFRWMQVATRSRNVGSPVYSSTEIAAVGSFLADRLMTPDKIRWFFTDMPYVADVVVKTCRQYGGQQFLETLHEVLTASPAALVRFLDVYIPASSTNQPGSPLT